MLVVSTSIAGKQGVVRLHQDRYSINRYLNNHLLEQPTQPGFLRARQVHNWTDTKSIPSGTNYAAQMRHHPCIYSDSFKNCPFAVLLHR